MFHQARPQQKPLGMQAHSCFMLKCGMDGLLPLMKCDNALMPWQGQGQSSLWSGMQRSSLCCECKLVAGGILSFLRACNRGGTRVRPLGQSGQCALVTSSVCQAIPAHSHTATRKPGLSPAPPLPQPWASDSIILGVSFPTCKMGTMVPTQSAAVEMKWDNDIKP